MPTSPNDSMAELLATRTHQATSTIPICKNEANAPAPAAQAPTHSPCQPAQPGPGAARLPQMQERTQHAAEEPPAQRATGVPNRRMANHPARRHPGVRRPSITWGGRTARS